MTELAMKRVVYVSTAAPDLSEDAVKAIAEDAQRNNQRRGLTGLMAFNGLNFIQALEGAAADVDDVFAAIRRDKRHSGVIALIEEPCLERQFPDWRMRYVRAASGALLNGKTALGPGDVGRSGEVARLFGGFLRLATG